MPMKSSDTTAPIVLGTHTGVAEPPLRVFYESPELVPHNGRPWLVSWLEKRHGKSLSPLPPPAGEVTIPADFLTAHALLVGNSGSGKTRLSLHLFREHLKRGCSGVFMDFKSETIRQAIQCATDAGLDKDHITVVWPADDIGGIPGWNPFAVPLEDAEKSVGRFTSTIRGCFDSWGDRMDNLLKNAALVMAGQRLSLWELVQFIQPTNEMYRAAILRQAKQSPAWDAYPIRHEYFETDFKSVSKTESVSATLNKLTTLLSNRYLRSMLCSQDDQLQLERLWQQPRAILIHLDQDALTYDGAGLLAGMIAQNLFAIAMRKPGEIPVVLMMDELESQERYLGDSLKDILSKSRSQGIRMIGACQNIEQMSPELRRLFMGAALRAFFNLEWNDAKTVSPSLCAGNGGRDTRVSVTADPDEWVSVSAYVADGKRNRLKVTEASWKLFETVGKGALDALKMLGRASHIPTLFVLSPEDNTLIPLDAYVKGLHEGQFRFHGPTPIRVTVTFPRPVYKVEEKKTEAERTGELTKKLSNLPNREAIVKLRGGTFSHIKVTEVSFGSLPAAANFLGNGQTAIEINDTAKGRTAAIVRLSGGRAAEHNEPYKEVSSGGNL